MKTFVSVCILTFNESINIKNAILSASKISDDIVVLDSHSIDNTCEIATNLNCRVHYNKFKGYASQRNFALKEIDYKYSWLLMLDADEQITDEMVNELKNLDLKLNTTMYSCRRKDHLLGKWLKFSSGYPTWFPRLFKVGFCYVEREINEVYRTTGEHAYLEGHLNHFPFAKGMDDWFAKHNRYSRMEAELLANKDSSFSFKGLFSKELQKRRENQKNFVYKLPLRPVWVFLIFYIYKRGFLDGRVGFYYCIMKLCYELMISCKEFELKNKMQTK